MLVPYNRHLLVEPVREEDKGEAFVLIPDSSVTKPTYSLVKLTAVAPDCEKFSGDIGSTLLVNTSMIEEIKVSGKVYNLILENYVIGLYHEGGTGER